MRTNEDTWWQPDRRELVSEVIARARAFVRFLYTRSERNIAVVSHGVFLETLVSADVLGLVDPAVRGRRFANCEVRSLVVGGWAPGLRAAGQHAHHRKHSSSREVRSRAPRASEGASGAARPMESDSTASGAKPRGSASGDGGRTSGMTAATGKGGASHPAGSTRRMVPVGD